nr:hypothetical protein [Nocardia noduli]
MTKATGRAAMASEANIAERATSATTRQTSRAAAIGVANHQQFQELAVDEQPVATDLQVLKQTCRHKILKPSGRGRL